MRLTSVGVADETIGRLMVAFHETLVSASRLNCEVQEAPHLVGRWLHPARSMAIPVMWEVSMTLGYQSPPQLRERACGTGASPRPTTKV